MSLEDIKKELDNIECKIFRNQDLSTNELIKICLPLSKSINQLEKKIKSKEKSKSENQKTIREGDDDFQMVY